MDQSTSKEPLLPIQEFDLDNRVDERSKLTIVHDPGAAVSGLAQIEPLESPTSSLHQRTDSLGLLSNARHSPTISRGTNIERDSLDDLEDQNAPSMVDSASLKDTSVPEAPILNNFFLDNSAAAHDGEITSKANAVFARRIIINTILVVLWFLFSISISLYNKWMFSPEHLNFHFPLFTTTVHMIIQFFLSMAVMGLWPQFRPIESMTLKTYIKKIAPCGVATGGDVGLGNMSLELITLAFYTMVKSSSLAFVLLFSFLFGLEQPTIKLAVVISFIIIGVTLMVASETKFQLVGFLLCLTASMLSGLRWALTQLLLKKTPATANPFSTIFFLAPVMGASTFVFACIVEHPLEFFSAPLWSEKGVALGMLTLFFPGLLAFSMTASEFALLQRSSVITLSICGILKEVLTILFSCLIFHDKLTPVNITGLVITILAMSWYNYMRMTSFHKHIHAKTRAESSPDNNNNDSEVDPTSQRNHSSETEESIEMRGSESSRRPLQSFS